MNPHSMNPVSMNSSSMKPLSMSPLSMNRPTGHRSALRTVLVAAALTLLVSLNLGGGCATGSLGPITGNTGNPNTDRWLNMAGAGQKAIAAASISEEQEDEMGKAIAIEVGTTYHLDSNRATTDYVTLVGLMVASATNRPDGNWVFGVLNSNEVNAFSGPNGYILITRGLLNQCRDESELAGVLAHEMAHILHKDVLNTVKHQGLMDAAAQAANTDQHIAQFSKMTNGGVEVLLKKGYDRDQEAKADADAVRYLIDAGYDPRALVRLVQRLAAQQSNSSSNGGTLMSTHPGLKDRAAKLQTRIQDLRAPEVSPDHAAILKSRFEQTVQR